MKAALLVPLFLSFSPILVAGRMVSEIERKSVSFASYRLNENVVPDHYFVHIEDDFDCGMQIRVSINRWKGNTETSNQDTHMPGISNIQEPASSAIEGKEDNYASNQLLMHVDKDVRLDWISYVQTIAGRDTLLTIKQLKLDEKKQLIAIVFEENLEVGSKGLLTFKFKPKIRDDFRGLHSVNYTNINDGVEQDYRIYLTRFQPSDARLFFPCFDEPQFKAEFDLKFSWKSRLHVLSNASKRYRGVPKNVRYSKFERTDIMPLHMFAFAVGEFTYMETNDLGGRKIKLRIYTSPCWSKKVKFALEVATRAIQWMEDYTDSHFPLTRKFDILCVLNHYTDNTENWGLAIIQSRYCHHDEGTLQSTKISIAMNVAHVVAHQWYGNLVTAKWWDSLWITEGAAAFLAFKMIKQLYPTFESDYFVQFETLSSGIVHDYKMKHKIHSLARVDGNIENSEDVNELFDSLEFTKSGSLFKLMENKIGESNFKLALRKLIQEHSHGSIDKDDLASVLPRENQQKFDLGLFRTQIDQVRAPELNLKLYKKGDKFQLICEQGMFEAHYLNATLHFYEFEEHEERRHEYQRVDLRSVVNSYPEWFDFSNENHYLMIDADPDVSQYYHINIDESLETNFRRVIEHKRASPMGRAALIEHAIRGFKLAGPGYTERLERWLSFYEGETEFVVVLRLLEAMQLITVQGKDSNAVESLLFKIQYLFGKKDVFFPLATRKNSFKSEAKYSLIGGLAQTVALTSLVKADVVDVHFQALMYFDERSGEIPQTYLRDPVYTSVVKYGTETQVEQLVKKMVVTDSLEERMRLVSLFATHNRYKFNDDRLERFCSKANEFLPIDMLTEAEKMCEALLGRKRKSPHDEAESSNPQKSC